MASAIAHRHHQFPPRFSTNAETMHLWRPDTDDILFHLKYDSAGAPFRNNDLAHSTRDTHKIHLVHYQQTTITNASSNTKDEAATGVIRFIRMAQVVGREQLSVRRRLHIVYGVLWVGAVISLGNKHQSRNCPKRF